MKTPAWLVITPAGRDGTTALFDVRVRKWHPGFWLHVVKHLLRPNATARTE